MPPPTDIDRTRERVDGAATRSAIQVHAAALFAERGFGDTSVRLIARAADCDPALVVRYFGSKEALFLETMSMDGEFVELLDGPLDGLGGAIVERLVGRTGSTRSLYTALMRASDRPDVRQYLARVTVNRLAAPLVDRLPSDDTRLRAHLIAAAIGGLLNALWILEDPELSDASSDDLARNYGPVLQLLIDGL